MKQQTLTGFEKYGKTTRRAQFLADMDRIIPWPEMTAAVETVYPKISESGGRPPILWSGCCGSTSCSCGSTCRTRRWRKPCTTRSRCATLWASIWALRERRMRRRCASSGTCWSATIGQDAAEGGQRTPAPQRHQDRQRHDRRCDDHRRAQLDQEQGRGARPGDASDCQGPAVVLRDEGARWSRQQDEADPHDPGLGGQRARPRCAAAPAARQGDAGLGRSGISRPDAADAPVHRERRTSPTSAIDGVAGSTRSRRRRTAPRRACEPRSSTCSV